jgi:sulfopyruvate decarboxylase TPP-binding subunit
MGSIVEPALRLCEAEIYRVGNPAEVAATAERALQQAFGDDRVVALLLSQQLIGRKLWTK